MDLRTVLKWALGFLGLAPVLLLTPPDSLPRVSHGQKSAAMQSSVCFWFADKEFKSSYHNMYIW